MVGRLRPFILLVTTLLVVATLYRGRAVLLPVALATLVAFVLSPAAGALQRRGLGRALSGLLVAVLVFSALGAAAWAVSNQLTDVIRDLPGYTETVKEKIAALRQANRGSALDRAQSAMNEVVGELQKETGRTAGSTPAPATCRRRSPRPAISSSRCSRC